MAKVLVMTLRNEAGEEFNIRVRHPKDTLTAQEVQSVMDTIIAKSVFPTTGGDLTAKVGASIEGTTRTTLFEEEGGGS